MLPAGELNLLLEEDEIEEEQIPSLTYLLDEEKGIIEKKVDGLEALNQSLWLILQTERMEFEIYSEDYGVELVDLIGQHTPLIYVNIEDSIREALMQDDRVESVEDFSFKKIDRHSVSVEFTVISAEGQIDMQQEVAVHG